jgi:hypothetical protein
MQHHELITLTEIPEKKEENIVFTIYNWQFRKWQDNRGIKPGNKGVSE